MLWLWMVWVECFVIGIEEELECVVEWCVVGYVVY